MWPGSITARGLPPSEGQSVCFGEHLEEHLLYSSLTPTHSTYACARTHSHTQTSEKARFHHNDLIPSGTRYGINTLRNKNNDHVAIKVLPKARENAFPDTRSPSREGCVSYRCRPYPPWSECLLQVFSCLPRTPQFLMSSATQLSTPNYPPVWTGRARAHVVPECGQQGQWCRPGSSPGLCTSRLGLRSEC